ncbi:hypothetical protein IVB45_02215 [Bradyrhizobium sp. 4]|uniref:hypothetical protein n=1 Tax=Bradyrhizobium sp. 4 TaxID=2782678 RepID=UPI001FFEF647|nr:hypothetical protein [Bradyrhizobium sp. 4]UPJ35849.1 hypothetical protein IVB45_02215 [Bradyrhizobium sp. 4]
MNVVLSALFLISSVVGFNLGQHQSLTFGQALPSATAIFETSLQSAITSSATTMTLTANAVRGGGALSGYNCFTIDEGSAQAETVCGTVSSTAVTAMTRGISQSTGTTTVAALQFAHRRGANVKITDFPLIQILKAQLNGEDTIPNSLLLDTIARYTSAPTFTQGSNQLVTALYAEGYANNVIAGGSPTSTETIGGKVRLATQLQMASSTDLGITAPLVLQAKYATSSPGYAGLWTVITNNAGKIAQTFLDLTQSYTWTGLHIFTAGFISNASSTVKSLNVASSTMIWNGVYLQPRFGGTGTDGVLSISSGTTTISAASASYLEKNYTSISITGTGHLAFSNANTNGTFIVLRSQGGVTLTCSPAPCIDVSGMGASGGAGGATGASSGSTGSTGNPFYLFVTNGGVGGSSGSPAAGALPTAILPTSWSTTTLMKYGGQFWVGAGGGGGGTNNASNNATQGPGGNGGGGLLLEVAGSLNFTTTNGIIALGLVGSSPTNMSFGGGGGGGAGGLVKIVYNSLIANSGTINVTGGVGGLGGSNAGCSCGAGGSTAYSQGTSGATGVSCTGGAGASGFSSVEQNTSLF